MINNQRVISNQLVQVQQLGLLNDNIENIIDSYLPPDSPNLNNYDSKRVLAKLSVGNLDTSNQLVANFRPSISDQVKVGFYSTDRFTQTDESEIISLKTATETLENLCNGLASVKYDLKFSKDSFKHQFDLELHNKSLEIYGKMNEKLKQLKNQQDDSLERIRQAYRSQLANALTQVGQFTQERSKVAIKQAKLNNDSKKDEYGNKIKELQKTIYDLEARIETLVDKLQMANENAKADHDAILNQLKEEKEHAVEEILMLSKKIGRLEEAVSIKEDETDKLLAEVASLQLQLEKEKIMTEQLNRDLNELQARNESEKQKLKKDFEKQKVQMETKLHDKIKESRAQILNAAKLEMTQQEQEVQRKRKEFDEHEKSLKEKLVLAETLQKEKEKEVESISKVSKKEDVELITKLKKNEEYLKSDIQRLKREIQRTNETWEKKFEVLKKSLHAIKDEMYVRQNLQKQSVHLAYASLAYTTDEVPGYQYPVNEISSSSRNNNHLKNEKPILPSINNNQKGGNGGGGGLERQLSFTISVPSRLSGHLDADETQIVDDEEMIRIKEDYLKDLEFIKPPMYDMEE